MLESQPAITVHLLTLMAEARQAYESGTVRLQWEGSYDVGVGPGIKGCCFLPYLGRQT